jgi:hypothetical protein
VPRLWIDVVAHVEMGRDKRQYRFLQETRYGRAVLAESYEAPAIAQAVMRYVAGRLVERERALANDARGQVAGEVLRRHRQRGRVGTVMSFLLGLLFGAAALFVAALLVRPV